MSSKPKTKSAAKEVGKAAAVPQLRFSDFRDSEGWDSYVLEDLENLGWVELGRGEVISNQDIKAIPGDFPIYSSSVKNDGLMGKYGKFMFDEELISWSVDGGGDFFYRRPHKFSVTNVSGYMRLNTSHLNYRFTASQLQARHSALTFDYQFKAHPSVIRKLYHLAIPSPAEQQKIAECLSSVDELIAAQAQKLDALKTHKKALMQQLFPREGETQPRLRFPEFRNAGDWVEDKLIDIATFRRGSFPQPYGLPEWYDEDGGMPFVQVFDVGDNFRLKERTKNKISNLGAEKSVFIPSGTLIVTLQGSIGRVAITHYDAYIDRTLLIFETFLKPIEKVFFARLIQNLFDIEKEIAPGGIIKTITKEALSDFKVKLPTIEEQQRIAVCLTTLDVLLAAQTQRLDDLKKHKQGLMQQLFPSPKKDEA